MHTSSHALKISSDNTFRPYYIYIYITQGFLKLIMLISGQIGWRTNYIYDLYF